MVFGLSSQSRYVCIDIQFDEVHFAVVRKEADFFEIDFIQKIVIDGGVFEGFHIQTPGKIADVLYEIKKKFGTISVLVSIPESSSYTALLPGEVYSSYGDIQRAIYERIAGPVYVWTHTFKKDTRSHIVIHAANKQVCDSLYSLIKNSGFANITMYPRALVLAEIHNVQNAMICDLGINQISIFSLYGTHVSCFSIVPFGTNALNQKIKSRFSLTDDEVLEVLAAYGTSALPRKEGHIVHGLVHTFLVPVADEIQSLAIRRAEHGLTPATQIFVSGTLARYEGLIEDLAHITHTDVQPLNVWDGIIDFENYIPDIHKNESYQYVGIAGLMNVLKKGTRYEPFDLR